MATTLTEINRTLKKIIEKLDEVGRGAPTIIARRAQMQDLSQLATELQAQSTTLSLINGNIQDLEQSNAQIRDNVATGNAVLTTIDSDTNLMQGRMFHVQSVAKWLSDVSTQLASVDGDQLVTWLKTINTSITTMDAVIDQIKTNTDPDGGFSVAALLGAGTSGALAGLSFGGKSLGGMFDGTEASIFTLILAQDVLAVAALDAIVIDQAAAEVLLGTIDTSLNNIESDVDANRTRLITISDTLLTHTFNWFLDITINTGGVLTVTVVCPTGQKLTNAWFTATMPVQTQTNETVEVTHTSAGDDKKRLLGNITFANTTAIHHLPRSRTTGEVMDATSFSLAAGEKLSMTFSSLTAADQMHLNIGGDLRDNTAFTASTITSSGHTINTEDHEEIA